MAKIDPASITWDDAGIVWDDEKPKKGSTWADVVGGLIRGAGSIGATLRAPTFAVDESGKPDMRPGYKVFAEERGKNVAAQDAALSDLGADPNSLAFKLSKLVSEVGGTMGAGGALGSVAQAFGAAPRVVSALSSSGMTTGGPAAGGVGARAADMALRSGAGGVTGASASAMVSPEDAATGGVIGAALPPALKGAGAVGSAVGGVFKSEKKKAAEELARALNLGTADDVARAVKRLREAERLVPGSTPTVAQALQTPEAAIVQGVVGDSAGGSAVRNALAAQNAARVAALDGVAPVVPTGVATARDELGRSIIAAAKSGDAAARQRTRDLFNEVPLDDAAIYLPVDKIRGARDKFFGAGSFGDRAQVDEAVKAAEALGLQSVDGLKAMTSGEAPKTLAQAVRQAGGISITNHSGLRGEVAGLQGDLKNLVRRNGGLSPAAMAERMYEAGYLADDSVNGLIDALKGEAIGRRSVSIGDDWSRQYGAMRDAAMGEAPAASSIPRLTSLREIQNYRSSLGNEARIAAQKPNDKAASALQQMRQVIDDKINEVVRGDGAIDENLPIDWANKLSDALKSKREQVQQFRTGPQAALFRTGRDGAPVVQGGEAASLFWGAARPGLADDVQSFKRLIGDNPKLLGQFRSMVTTEGASTASAGGNLGQKFVRWVENTLPGLKQALDPDQVKTLERIAQDIKRNEAAVALAGSVTRKSNTYQNAQNALSLGMLDSPLVGMAANRVPVVGGLLGPALDGLKSSARQAKAQRLGGLLSDADLAAESLGLLNGRPGLLARGVDRLLPLIYRGAPALSTSQ